MKMKILLIIFTILLIPKITDASVTFEQEDYSTTVSTTFMRTGLNVSKIAVEKTATSTEAIESIELELLRTTGDPTTANFNIKVYAGGTNPENGTLIATSETVSSASLATTISWITFNFTTPIEYNNGTRYYYVLESTDLDDPKLQIVSSSNTWEWRYCNGCGGNDWQDSGEEFSIKLNSPGYANNSSGQFEITKPTQSQTLPSISTTIEFTYYNNSVADYYDKVGARIINISTGQTLVPLEENIIGSGGQSFSTTTNLAGNNEYQVQGYMRSSTGSSTPIYSNSIFFCVVSCPYSSTPLPDDYLIPTYTGSSTTTAGQATSTGGIGSTTIPFVNNILPENINAVLSTKFPFSYVYDFVNLLEALANGTTSNNAQISFAEGVVFTNRETSATSSTFTLINQEDIEDTGYITDIRDLIQYTLLFTTALYVIGLALTAI